jgi:hypothetical protein
MYSTCKNSTASLRLIDNLIVSPDTSTVNGELCWMTWLQNQEASGLKQRLIVCVISVTHWSVSNVATRILIRTKKFKTVNKTLRPLDSFESWHPWQTSADPSLETPIQTVNLWCLYTYKHKGMDHSEWVTGTAANNVPWTNSNDDDRVPHPHTVNVCVQGQSYVTIWEQILEDKLVLYNVALVVDSSAAILTH